MTEADFEKRLRELMKPVKAEWEEHLAEVTGPQVDEVHKAEEQLAKYVEGEKPDVCSLLREVADTLRYLEDVKGAGVDWPKILDLALRVEDCMEKLKCGSSSGHSNLDPEEEEYEEARRRALRTRGPTLFPV